MEQGNHYWIVGISGYIRFCQKMCPTKEMMGIFFSDRDRGILIVIVILIEVACDKVNLPMI